MTRVEEFLETAIRESKDPAIARKLMSLLDALKRGDDLGEAARRASLDGRIAIGLLDAIQRDLKDNLKPPSSARVPKSASRTGGKPGAFNVDRLVAVSDGASRGNPGKAACAVIVYDEGGEELLRRSKPLGVVTNNVAEYEGVLLALELASQLRARTLELKLDSELVVKQLNRQYKVKHESMKPLFARAVEMMRQFEAVDVVHVKRAETKEVDKLANDELDGKLEP